MYECKLVESQLEVKESNISSILHIYNENTQLKQVPLAN